MTFITIQHLAELTGTTTHTLRAWERRYQALTPQRTPTGRRLYSFGDVEKVRLLTGLIRTGLQIGQIANLSPKELRGLRSAEDEVRIQNPQSEVEIQNLEKPTVKQIQHCLGMIENYNLEALEEELTYLKGTLAPQNFVLEILVPLMRKIGANVEKGQLSIGQEHAVSAMVRSQLSLVNAALKALPKNEALRYGFAALEGDHHELALLFCYTLALSAGTRGYYIGPNMPLDALVETCRHLRIHRLVLSLTGLPEEHTRMSIGNFVMSLLQQMPEVQIWVGGNGQDRITFSHQNLIKVARLEEFLEKLTPPT